MFTKVGDVFYHDNEKDNTKDIGKKYICPENLEVLDFVHMAEESDYDIKGVTVYVDDDYSYGSGIYGFESFYEIYDKSFMIDSLCFNSDKHKIQINVYPEKHEAYLIFLHVKEMPALELSDIFQEKKKRLG